MPVMLFEIAVIFCLTFANGLFAMTEMALIAARRTWLEHKAAEGHKGALAALKLLEQPTHFISTMQFGITLIGVFAGAFSGASIAEKLAIRLRAVPIFAESADGLALFGVVLAITMLSLVMGELVPKQIALRFPEKIAILMAGPVSLLNNFMHPAIVLFSAATHFILKRLGIPDANGDSCVTQEEIRLMVEKGVETGALGRHKSIILNRVLALDDVRVDSFMTPRPKMVCLDLQDDSARLLEKITSSFHSRFPVCSRSLDDFYGVIEVRDILPKLLKGMPVQLLEHIQQPLVVPNCMGATGLIDLFKRRSLHFAVVVGEYGSVQGVVTLSDLLKAIVGEIPSKQQRAHQQGDGSWVLDALAPVGRLKEIFGATDFGETMTESSSNIGRLAMACLGRVPTVGAVFEVAGLQFEIIGMEGLRVEKVRVRRASTVGSAFKTSRAS